MILQDEVALFGWFKVIIAIILITLFFIGIIISTINRNRYTRIYTIDQGRTSTLDYEIIDGNIHCRDYYGNYVVIPLSNVTKISKPKHK